MCCRSKPLPSPFISVSMSVCGSGIVFFFFPPRWMVYQIAPNCSFVTCSGPRIGCTFIQLYASALLSMSFKNRPLKWNRIWNFYVSLEVSGCTKFLPCRYLLLSRSNIIRLKKMYRLFFNLNVTHLHLFSFQILFIYFLLSIFGLALPKSAVNLPSPCLGALCSVHWGYGWEKMLTFHCEGFLFVCLFPCTKIFDRRCKMAGRKGKRFSFFELKGESYFK